MATNKRQVGLFIRKRPVKNLIGLRDPNERGLTYTLGYMIWRSLHLRNRLFEETLGSGSLAGKKISVKIEEPVPDYGVLFDICILVDDKPGLIIEGKYGTNKPGKDQCRKYVRYLNHHRTRGRQHLLYVLDWYDEEETKEIVKLTLKKARLSYEYRRRYIHEGITWEKILGWCTDILDNNKDSLKPNEKTLLRQYADYLEADRYAHGSLGNLKLDKKELKRLKYIWDELVAEKDEHRWSLKPVPYQDERADYLYVDMSERRQRAGYIGFKKKGTHNRVFGLYFQWKKKNQRGNLGKVFVWVRCKDQPSELQGECKNFYDRKESEGSVQYEEEYNEYRFDVTNAGSASELITDLNESRFFDKAIEQA